MNALPDAPTPDRTDHAQVAAAPALSDTPPPAARRGALAFTEPDGPVVVVCGLHGGAGTSTLALLLAHYAAAASSVPVLLCEASGASGDQLALGAPESAVSLDSLAITLAIGARPQDGWWAERENLRVLATPPAAPLDSPAGVDLCGTLRAAAREHGLTVVDGGSVRDHSTRELLGCATHVIWALSIQPGAVEQARAVLAGGLVPALDAAQAFALRTDRRSAGLTRAVRDLRRVAESHSARQLLLLPYAPALATRPVELDCEPLHRPLSSLHRFLRSP
jgi:hypothetical protein